MSTIGHSDPTSVAGWLLVQRQRTRKSTQAEGYLTVIVIIIIIIIIIYQGHKLALWQVN
jgi:hypothetical protein